MPIKYYISSTKYSLQERMTKRGRVYDVVFRIVTLDGDEKQKKLSGFFTKTLAKEAYTKFITENCELVKNNPLKKKKALEQKKQDLTFEQLVPIYIASLKNQNKESCIVDKMAVFKNHLTPYFKDMKLPLSEDLLYRWQDELWGTKNPRTGEYYAYYYLSKIRNWLNGFLVWAESRHGYTNYLPKVKKPKRRRPKTEMLFWTREEFEQFISVVDDKTYRAMFLFLFYTGRRKGEVLALQKSDIKENEIIFSKTYTRKTIDGAPYKITTTKNEKIGKTPICKPLRELINEYDFQTPFAFGGERPIHENTLSHAFERYIEKAGVKRIRVHDLRHSFVSMLVHLGANFSVVADLIGDTLEQVTKTYAHLYNEDKVQIINRI